MPAAIVPKIVKWRQDLFEEFAPRDDATLGRLQRRIDRMIRRSSTLTEEDRPRLLAWAVYCAARYRRGQSWRDSFRKQEKQRRRYEQDRRMRDLGIKDIDVSTEAGREKARKTFGNHIVLLEQVSHKGTKLKDHARWGLLYALMKFYRRIYRTVPTSTAPRAKNFLSFANGLLEAIDPDGPAFTKDIVQDLFRYAEERGDTSIRSPFPDNRFPHEKETSAQKF